MQSSAVFVVGFICIQLGFTQANFFKYLYRRRLEKRVIERECGATFADRQACGRNVDRLTEIECRARSCCWEDRKNNQGSPRCFLPKRMVSKAECAVRYEMKDDCGYWDITEQECTNSGCCYRPGAQANEPDCFYPLDTKLEGGETNNTGRVLVFHDNEWGSVCDDNFGVLEAGVVCKSIGFMIGGEVISSLAESDTYVNILLDDVSCNGKEDSLHDCKHGDWGQHDCSHSEDVAVRCYTSEDDMVSSGVRVGEDLYLDSY